MDGVLVDFVRGICDLRGRDNPYTDPTNFGNFDMDKIWGISPDEFWDGCGFDFWNNLHKTKECDEILGILDNEIGLERVCLLTAPSSNDGCVDGKISWVRRHIPEFKKRILVGSCKEFVAAPRKLLIDDRDSNIASWLNAGGCAFTFPQPWNAAQSARNSWRADLKRAMENPHCV